MVGPWRLPRIFQEFSPRSKKVWVESYVQSLQMCEKGPAYRYWKHNMFEKAVLYGLVVKKLTLLCGVLESGKLLGAVRSSRERERERRPRRGQLSALLFSPEPLQAVQLL